MPLQQALVGLLMHLQGGRADVRLGDLTVSEGESVLRRRTPPCSPPQPHIHTHTMQAPLRTLAQALAPLSPRTVVACLPMVTLPVYSVLTSPDAAPGKDGERLQRRSPAEADALVAALECVQVRTTTVYLVLCDVEAIQPRIVSVIIHAYPFQTAATKAGPRFIQEEPTAFLKLLTHLALWLGALVRGYTYTCVGTFGVRHDPKPY